MFTTFKTSSHALPDSPDFATGQEVPNFLNFDTSHVVSDNTYIASGHAVPDQQFLTIGHRTQDHPYFTNSHQGIDRKYFDTGHVLPDRPYFETGHVVLDHPEIVTGTGYLSVLISNSHLRESFQKLESIVNRGIQLEEKKKNSPKPGYGSRFNSTKRPQSTSTRNRSLSRSVRDQRLTGSSPLRRGRYDLFKPETRPVSAPPLPLIRTNIERLEAERTPDSSIQRNIDSFVIGTLDNIYAARKKTGRDTNPLWFPNSEFRTIYYSPEVSESDTTSFSYAESDFDSVSVNTTSSAQINSARKESGQRRNSRWFSHPETFTIYAARKESSRDSSSLWFSDSESYSSSTDSMLSPPEIPGGGLQRSNTSFGVFSNLASHSRFAPPAEEVVKHEEPLVVATSGPQLQVTEAVKQADRNVVEKLLKENATLSLRFIDENDRTVLHHCFDIKNQGVNLGMLQLLLNRNPPINDCGKNEVPVLHVAAKMGHALAVYLLIKHGADVNVKHKKTQRTALHEAVANGHKITTVVLLYFGAVTSFRDRDGRIAIDHCKDNTFSRQDFEAIVESIEQKWTEIQEISSNFITFFENLTISVKLRCLSEDKYLVIFRRQNLETCKTPFHLRPDEELGSDVFAYHLLKVAENATATISLPLFEKSISPKENVNVRTSSGNDISQTEVNVGKEGLRVVFDTVLNQSDCMIAVCKPSVEQWQVGKAQQVLTSTVDERINIHIKRGTFSANASVTLQLIELPEHIDLREDAILASTPFFKFDASCQPSQDIMLELPILEVSSDGGQLTVLAKSGDDWNVMDIHTTNKQNTVCIAETNFPVIATVVVAKPGSDSEKVVNEISEPLRQVMNVEYKVCFLCLTKRIVNTKKFAVFTECCEFKSLDSRRRWWEAQGYQVQEGKDPQARVTILSKQAFRLEFYESRITRKDPRTIDIQFHCKRENIVQFTVELKGKSVKFINGRLYVYAMKPNDTNSEQVMANEPITWFDVSLVLNQMEAGMGSTESDDSRSSSTLSVKSQNSSRSDSARSGSRRTQPPSRDARSAASRGTDRRPSAKSSNRPTENQTDALKKVQESLTRALKNIDPISEANVAPTEVPEIVVEPPPECITFDSVFLDDVMLDNLITEFKDDWYKIFVLMGVSFDDIEYALFQSKNTSSVKRKLFRNWRDAHKNDEDAGIPLLLGALFKGGCRNTANTVQVKLREWYDFWKGKDVSLQAWIAKAYQTPDLLVPSDYPKPMSDPYLVLMSDELPFTPEFARALMIGEAVAADIQLNPTYLIDSIRVMKLLTLFRDRSPRGIDALETLISSLGKLGFEKIRNYAIMCAKAWVKRTATRKDDPLRYQVDSLMKKIG